MAGLTDRDGRGEVVGRHDRQVGVAAGPDVGDRPPRPRRASASREAAEHGRRAVERRAARRPPRRGRPGSRWRTASEGRRDRRRVVAVVVVDHDADGLALALQAAGRPRRTSRDPAAIADRRTRPSSAAPPATADGVRGVVPAGGGEPHGQRAGQLVQSVELEGRARLVARRRRGPGRRWPGPPALAKRSRDPADVAAALRRGVDDRVGHESIERCR